MMKPGKNHLVGILGWPLDEPNQLAELFTTHCPRFTSVRVHEPVYQLQSYFEQNLPEKKLSVESSIEAIQEAHGTEIWLEALKERFHQGGLVHVVLSDLRSKEQIEWVREQGGAIVVIRGGTEAECSRADVILSYTDCLANPRTVLLEVTRALEIRCLLEST